VMPSSAAMRTSLSLMCFLRLSFFRASPTTQGWAPAVAAQGGCAEAPRPPGKVPGGGAGRGAGWPEGSLDVWWLPGWQPSGTAGAPPSPSWRISSEAPRDGQECQIRVDHEDTMEGLTAKQPDRLVAPNQKGARVASALLSQPNI
jgi:hypothetical protein